MSAFSMSFRDLERFGSLYSLEDRNRLAEQKIVRYVTGHAAADIGIGILGTFIPGAGLAAIGASVLLQVPVYQQLAWDLGYIYSVTPDVNTKAIVAGGVCIGSAGMIAAEFTTEFFSEIAGDILREAGFAAVSSAIPFIGGIVAAGLDAAIAATMTWRVGTMVSIYYQNGQRWVGSRKDTYEAASSMVGGLSPENTGRVRLDGIPGRVAEVSENQVQAALVVVRMIRTASPRATEADIRAALVAERLPRAAIDEAIRRLPKLAA